MRIRIRPVFQATVACVIFFLGLEVLARVWSTLRPDLAEASVRRSWFRPSEALGWEWQPEFAGQAENDYREFDSQGFLKVDSKQAAEPGPNTVLFIGDSNTIGFGVPTAASFAEVIEELLPGVSTVNLGVNGYSSYQGLKVLEKHLPRIRPAAVVASFNFNDRGGVREREQDDLARFQQLYRTTGNVIVRRVNRVLEHLYLFGGMRSLAHRMGLLPGDTLDQPVKLYPRVDKPQYRENLEAIARITERAGVPLVFILLRDSPLQTGHLIRGVEKLEKSEYQAAIEYLTVVVRTGGWFSYLGEVYLARARQELGKGGEVLQEVRGRTGQLVFLDRDYNSIMNEVASQHDIPVVDAASVLEADPYVFIDFCHFNSAGHRKVAQALAPVLAETLNHAPSGRGQGSPGESVRD